MEEREKIRTSRFLSLVLRHKPQEASVTLDANGWADVKELLRGVNERGRSLTLEQLQDIAATDDKKRYMFSEDGRKIRACQGHSIDVDVELKTATPPEFLYHGTAKRFVDAIFREGLISRSRQYVHLSFDEETAQKVGARHGKPYIFLVEAKKMEEDGFTFYLSENGVWLTKTVPPKYLRWN